MKILPRNTYMGIRFEWVPNGITYTIIGENKNKTDWKLSFINDKKEYIDYGYVNKNNLEIALKNPTRTLYAVIIK